MSALPGPPVIRDTDDLVAALGVPYTDEQLAAITAPLEPAVIVAGAGSGKTTVMAARVVWLVGTGQVQPDAVLGLTFTNKAAAELGHRIRRALAVIGPRPAAGRRAGPAFVVDEAGSDPGEPAVSTYHAFAGQLIAEHGLRLGIEPRARLLADPSRYQLAARAISRAPGPYPGLTKSVSLLVPDVLALAAELAEHLVEVDALRAHDRALLERLGGAGGGAVGKVAEAADKRLQLADLVQAYQEAKAEADLVDFSDQMALAARLAEQSPAVGRSERARYQVVLLDEYQDTSVAQRRMLVGLFGGGHPVTAVGGPCQAIYGWRGASVANLEDFPAHFPIRAGSGAGESEVPARRFTLRENRRNGAVVLDLANGLAAPLHAVHTGVAPLVAHAAAAGQGEVRTGLLPTWVEELEWVGAQVATALGEGIEPGEVAVLVRTTRDIGPLHQELTKRQIPTEVVGLGGLVHLPEVADVIAMLEVLDEITANAALVRLLTGPRWRIGARDLALLGRRAAELVAVEAGAAGSAGQPEAELVEAAGHTDPAEMLALSEAMGDLGPLPFSAQARRRLAAFDAELRALRRHAGEPLLDLVHRILAVTGLDTEIAAAPEAVAARRQAALVAFLDVAAGFVDLDGESSVAAFLAYLRAAEEHERGLDSATPAAADAVTIMTAHKAKGLEWDVVVLPDLTETVFPSNRGRARWTTRPEALPHTLRGDAAALPDVGEFTPKGLRAFEEQMRQHSQTEELRLAYVACTRPRRRLIASAHWWGPTQKRPRGPSAYLRDMRTFAGRPADPWAEPPEEGATNPLRAAGAELAWPAPLEPVAWQRRRDAARLVEQARRGALPAAEISGPDAARIAGWDADLTLLRAELGAVRPRVREVALPDSLSASQVLALAADPDGLARELARPMPRRPAPAARRGTRFHAWVQALFGQQPLLAAHDLAGAADADAMTDTDLVALQQAFLRGPYGELCPYRVEAPFALAIAGRVVRGRIDAVYEVLGGFEVVDWKTTTGASADPLQLALYRLAWAEIAGVAPEQVSAAFLFVRSGKLTRPALPDRAEVERLLGGVAGLRADQAPA